MVTSFKPKKSPISESVTLAQYLKQKAGQKIDKTESELIRKIEQQTKSVKAFYFAQQMELLLPVLAYLTVAEIHKLTGLCKSVQAYVGKHTDSFGCLITRPLDPAVRVNFIVLHYKHLTFVTLAHAFNNIELQRLLQVNY
jgi:hypothetical protein